MDRSYIQLDVLKPAFNVTSNNHDKIQPLNDVIALETEIETIKVRIESY